MKTETFELDTWKIGCIGTKHTGVETMIWISTNQCYTTPIILVGFNSDYPSSYEYAVTVESNPRIINSKSGVTVSPNIQEQIFGWIILNLEALQMLWNDEIPTADFILDYMRKYYNIEVAHDTNLVYKSMIGYAEQKGDNVYVYNTKGGFMWNRYGTLVSYTANTVTIKHGSTIYICGEHGEVKFTR